LAFGGAPEGKKKDMQKKRARRKKGSEKGKRRGNNNSQFSSRQNGYLLNPFPLTGKKNITGESETLEKTEKHYEDQLLFWKYAELTRDPSRKGTEKRLGSRLGNFPNL